MPVRQRPNNQAILDDLARRVRESKLDYVPLNRVPSRPALINRPTFDFGTGPGAPGYAEPHEEEPGFLSRFFDVISRPMYAVENLVKDTIDRDPNTDNPFESLWAGLSGIDKTSGRDILDEVEDETEGDGTIPDWLKGAIGFGADILLDPVSYIPGGVLLKGAKAGAKATGVTKIADKLTGTSELAAKRAGDITSTKADIKAGKAEIRRRTDEIYDEKLANEISQINHAKRRVDVQEQATLDAMGPVTAKVTPRDTPNPVFRTERDMTNDARNYLADDLPRIKDDNMAMGKYPAIKSVSDPNRAYHLDVADIQAVVPDWRGIPAAKVIQATSKMLDDIGAGVDRQAIVANINNVVSRGNVGPADEFANELVDKQADILKKLADNEYQVGLRDSAQGKAIGKEVADETAAKLDDPLVGVAENLQDVANINGKVKAKGQAQGVGPGGEVTGAISAAHHLDGIVDQADVIHARSKQAVSRDMAKATTPVDAKTQKRLRRDSKREAEAEYQTRGDAHDLAHVDDAVLDSKIARGLNGVARRAIHGHGHKALANLYRNMDAAHVKQQHVYGKAIDAFAKTHSKDAQEAAFEAMFKTGAGLSNTISDPAVRAAYDDMLVLMDNVIPTTPYSKEAARDIIAESPFLREGISFEAMNGLLKSMGLKNQFKVVKGQNAAETLQQIRKWNVDNPLEFLKKFQAAQTNAITRKKVADDWADKFGKESPQPGYSRIRAGDDNLMSPFIDKDLYYPNEQIRMMALFNRTFTQKTSFKGSTNPAAQLVNNVIDPFMRVWKPLVTIAKPGFHVRNIIGEFAMNAMAGLFSPKWYAKAGNIQRAIGRFTGDLTEFQRATKGQALPGPRNTAFSVILKGGKIQPVNYSEAGQLAMNHGLIISGRQAEDIFEASGKGALQTISDKLLDNKYMRGMTKVAEETNSHFRLAQFSKLMSDRKFTSKYDNIEDATNAAVTEVQKWHPDVAGLSKTEAKYGRRVFGFYTWFRIAMPRVIETMVFNPRRVNWIPKASFNAQVAMGLEPESMESPFPEGHEFPSYITENFLGPMSAPGGGLTSFNAGTPIEALADIVNPGVGKFAAGNLNPLLAAPLELAAGEDLTGYDIKDNSEYVDRLIPGAGLVTDVAGVSLAGTIGNWFAGQPEIDPQRKVAMGEKKHFDEQAMINFLTGLGFTNPESPAAQRSLTYEKYKQPYEHLKKPT